MAAQYERATSSREGFHDLGFASLWGGMARLPERDGIANSILLSLPRTSFQRIQPRLEFVELAKGNVIDRAGQPIERVYFVNRGLISLIKTMHDGRTVEISAVGIEGVTDAHALFGLNRAALDTIVQIPGDGLRISYDILKRLMAEEKALHEVMERYSGFAIGQLAQNAACNRLHSLEERCCRWLLMAHDSAISDTFPLTHEFLAMMLGVQRAGVSIAANTLQNAGLITYRRGIVTITNRSGLEDGSCECYGAMQEELGKLFPPPKGA
jgi:CRP-like cAMP-binding protein